MGFMNALKKTFFKVQQRSVKIKICMKFILVKSLEKAKAKDTQPHELIFPPFGNHQFIWVNGFPFLNHNIKFNVLFLFVWSAYLFLEF